MKKVAEKARFYGNVQGVGFRASVSRVADRLALSGCVKSLSNGSVEAILQGDRDRVEGGALQQGPSLLQGGELEGVSSHL